MFLIYGFSAQDAQESSRLSYEVSYKIVEVADQIMDTNLQDFEIASYADRIENLVRKAAHVTEYFLLAVAVAFPLYVYGVRGILLVFIAGAFCVLFACGDEYHQSFVDGRAPMLKDVGIDSIGILVGILFVRIIGWTGRKTVFHPLAEDADGRKLTRKELKRYEQEMERKEAMRQSRSRRGYPGNGGAARSMNRTDGSSAPYEQVPYYYNPGDSGQPPYRGRQPFWQGQGQTNPVSTHPDHTEKGKHISRPSAKRSLSDYDKRQDSGRSWNISPDDLCDDMPLSGILQPK